jgi:hypothetical protein
MIENKGYKKLIVYREAHELVKQVYFITEKYPRWETFGLDS